MFSAGRSPASLLLVCVPPRPTAAWLLLRSVVPYHSFSFCSDLAARSGCSFSLQVCSLLATHLPLRQIFFWPAIFDAQVSGFRYPSPAPPRLFLTGYFDAQVSAFRYPSPAPPRLLLTGYLDAQVSGFRCPSPVPPCGTPAVFTTPRFLPLRFRRFFWGLCSSAALMLAAPQSSPTSGRLALCAALRFACDFYRSTAPRFLPFSGFYRSAFAGFLGALLFRRPHACCPPVFTHFRAARSLCRLAVRLRFLPLRFRRFFFFFGGLCSSAALLLAAPQSSPSSGRTLWCRLVRSVSGGPPFLTLFLYRLLNRSRSVTAHLTGFPFVPFIHIRGPSIVSSFWVSGHGHRVYFHLPLEPHGAWK